MATRVNGGAMRWWLAWWLSGSLLAFAQGSTVNVYEGQLRLLPATGLWQQLGVEGLRVEGRADSQLLLQVSARSALELQVVDGSLHAFGEGRLQLDGALLLERGNEPLRLSGARLQPLPGESLRLALLDGSGAEWLRFDHMHFELHPLASDLRFWNVDVSLGKDLARQLGRPDRQGSYLGQAELLTRFQQPLQAQADPEFCLPVRWPGTLIEPGNPDAGRYLADVELIDLSGFTVNRCNTANSSCDGPGGVDAQMVISPSAELRNSNAANTAAVPWYEKFSGNFAPYGNDQHPFLIWNIYRVDADGRLVQIARSGVKHAFLTVNSACQSCPNAHPQNNFHILWPNCRDTYGTGNNDTNRHLGPRSEIAPHSVRWGRCGSIYDVNCDGGNDFPAQTAFDNRTRVLESALDLSLHPGASYQFEGWYLVREDINIYNTMGARSFVPSYSSGWQLGNTGPFSQGPVIDRWVAPGGSGLDQRNRELVSNEGRLKAAVRVQEIAPGRFRYDYAIANFSLAREITQGSEPNLRLVSNRGVGQVELPLPADAMLEVAQFADGDAVQSNDWIFTHSNGVLRLAMAEGNTLDWGSLYSFSFETDLAPLPGPLRLGMAELGSPAHYELTLLVPTLGPDDIFRDGAEGMP